MSEIICSFTSADKSGHEYKVNLEAQSIHAEKVKVLLKVSDDSNEKVHNIEIPIEVDLATNQFLIPAFTFSVNNFASCMALCGVPQITQEVAKCLQSCKSQSQGKSQCIISCLRGKGHEIVPSLAKCAGKCVVAGVIN